MQVADSKERQPTACLRSLQTSCVDASCVGAGCVGPNHELAISCGVIVCACRARAGARHGVRWQQDLRWRGSPLN